MSGDASISNAGAVSVSDLSIASEAEGDILYRGASNWVRLAKGTASQILQMNSGATAPEWTGTQDNMEVFTSDGTFTAPIGVTEVYLTMVGAGGGGGGTTVSNEAGTGGGSGAWGERIAYTVTPESDYTVQVGVGGSGGVGDNDGTDGEATIFDTGGSAITCNGGSKGLKAISGTASGGAGGTGDDGTPSGSTAGGYIITAGIAGADADNVGGGGGGSRFGKGGAGGANTGDDGSDAIGRGAGGGGGRGDGSDINGGDGADGIVIVEY